MLVVAGITGRGRRRRRRLFVMIGHTDYDVVTDAEINVGRVRRIQRFPARVELVACRRPEQPGQRGRRETGGRRGLLATQVLVRVRSGIRRSCVFVTLRFFLVLFKGGVRNGGDIQRVGSHTRVDNTWRGAIRWEENKDGLETFGTRIQNSTEQQLWWVAYF